MAEHRTGGLQQSDHSSQWPDGHVRPVPRTFTRLNGLPKDTYTAHVIAVNQMGAESPEGYLEFSIEAPPPPSHVDIEQGFFAVTMIPDLSP